MLCYRDMTFCTKSREMGGGQCLNVECPRYITPKLAADANEFGLPLSTSDLSSSCLEYNPETD